MKKFLSLLLSLNLLLSLLFLNCGFSQEVHASEIPVQLCYAKFGITSGTYGPSLTFYYNGYISVSDIGKDKNVTVHYSTDKGQTWNDTKATYYTTDTDKHQIWQFKIPDNPSSSVVFSIKYDVDGKSYEDNNGGKNYESTWCDIVSKNTLYVSSIDSAVPIKDGVVYGPINTSIYIMLKNLAYNKNVKIRYTLDNWKTYKEATASYNPLYISSVPSYEIWSASIGNGEIPPYTDKLEFAVSYEVNGIQYWDNNFGSNYVQDYKKMRLHS